MDVMKPAALLTRWLPLPLCLCLLCSAHAQGPKPLLELDFETYPPAAATLAGCTIAEAPPADAQVRRADEPGACVSFDGRSDVLVLAPLGEELSAAMRGAFTLELEARFDTLPEDIPAYPYVVEALDADLNTVLAVRGHKLGRFEVLFTAGTPAKPQSFLATWSHPTPTATRIFRRRWTHLAVTVKPDEAVTLFIDGEQLGSALLAGSLPSITALRLGGDNGKPYQKFHGRVDELRILPGAVYTEATSAPARERNAKRLRNESRQTWEPQLLPEAPDWARRHPRMVLTPSRLAALKTRLSTGRGLELRQRLLADCAEWINPESERYYDPDEYLLQQDRYPVLTPALLCLGTLLSDETAYARRAGEIVAAYADHLGYDDVAHYLVSPAGAAGTVMMMSLAYDWGYDVFTPEQRLRIRESLLETAAGAHDMFKSNDVIYGKWVANWSAMGVSTLGHACLAIMGESKAPVIKWLDLARHLALAYGHSAIDEQGAFHEGAAYFFYGAQHILVFLDALYTTTGEDLLQHANYARVPDYLAYMVLPWGQEVMPLKYCGSNCCAHNQHVLQLYRARVGSQATEWVWQKLYGPDKHPPFCQLFGMLWFRPESKALDHPGLPLATWFRGEGLLGFRSDWSSDGLAGAFYAHHARIVAHDQADRGQFVLYGYGGRWIVDSGGRQGRFSGHRDAHNLVTVDGISAQPNPLSKLNWHTDSFLTDVCHADDVATAAQADLTSSYRYLCNWQREIYNSDGDVGEMDPFDAAQRYLLFMREQHAPPYVLVLDDLQMDDAEHVYTWHLHTGSHNAVTVDGQRAVCHRPATGTLRFVHCPLAAVGSPGPKPSGDGGAEYDIVVESPGAYSLWGYGRSGDVMPGGMDSFLIDFAGRDNITWSADGNHDYKWLRVGSIAFDLAAGTHTLRVRLREPEARVARFALVPEGSTVLDITGYDRSRNIVVDASRPTRLRAPFAVGTEQERLFPEAKMLVVLLTPDTGLRVKPFYPDVLPPHPRLEAADKGQRGRFLAFCYPHKPRMETPAVEQVAQGRWRIRWKRCEDLVCLGGGSGAGPGVDSDASLCVLRTRRGRVTAYVMQNGSRLGHNGKRLLDLRGRRGTAMAAEGGTLAISGSAVTDFVASAPQVRRTLAHGKVVRTRRCSDGQCPAAPIHPRAVLTW